SVARKRCPVDSTANGRSHAGGELKPTAERSVVTSLIDSDAGKVSMTARSSGQARDSARAYSSGQSLRAIVDFPHPEGPVISPTFHGRSDSGNSTRHDSRLVCSTGRANR